MITVGEGWKYLTPEERRMLLRHTLWSYNEMDMATLPFAKIDSFSVFWSNPSSSTRLAAKMKAMKEHNITKLEELCFGPEGNMRDG